MKGVNPFVVFTGFILNITAMILIIITLNFGLTWDKNIDLFSNLSNACVFISAFAVGFFCYRWFHEMPISFCMTLGMLLGGLVGLLLYYSVRNIFPNIANSPHWIPFAAGIGVAWSLSIIGFYLATGEEYFGKGSFLPTRLKKKNVHFNDEDDKKRRRRSGSFLPIPEIYTRQPSV